MKIFDCFPFFNELEVLKIRCEELKNLDVTHVLIESSKTFTGLEKPLYFTENKDKFSQYNILNIVVDLPETKDPWERERYQRNYIHNILSNIANDEDIIIVSDADEIINSEVLKNANLDNGTNHLIMDNYYYYFNVLTEKQGWSASNISKYKFLKNHNLNEVRNTIPRPNIIENGGWHFGWLGGYERILKKLESFSHSELNIEKNRDLNNIKEKVDNNRLFWYDGDVKFTTVQITHDTHPKYLVDNLSEFDILIKKPTTE